MLFGDDAYLKRLVYEVLRREVLGDESAEFSEEIYEGRSVELCDVLDALSTVSLFGAGGRRLVVVQEADDFVSRNRAALEQYVDRPRSTGMLLLDVRAWPKNTRLAKRTADRGLPIDCSGTGGVKLRRWLAARASNVHHCELAEEAADFMIEVVGPQPGVLDQELAKLAVAVGSCKTVTLEIAQPLVGGGRARTAWDMLDAALSGHADEALRQLDRLLLAGENPIALLAQISSNLRRLATTFAIMQHAKASSGRVPALRDALAEAGVRSFVLQKSQAQLRHLGRARAGKLFRWLLEADLDLKGQSQLGPRTILERLLVRLAQPREPAGESSVAAR